MDSGETVRGWEWISCHVWGQRRRGSGELSGKRTGYRTILWKAMSTDEAKSFRSKDRAHEHVYLFMRFFNSLSARI